MLRNIFFILTALLVIHCAHASVWSFPRKTDHRAIINTIYSVGKIEKLTIVVLVNEMSVTPKERDSLVWMIDNIKHRLSDFVYCEHIWQNQKCTCKTISKSHRINYVYVNCFESLYDVCGKLGAPVILIIKNGLILNTVSRDVLLSKKTLTHEKEQKIIDTINNVYKKSLEESDFID
jgi:hypothetical protein